VRDVAVVGRGGKLLVLLAGEDVDGDEVALGVAVLAWDLEKREKKNKKRLRG